MTTSTLERETQTQKSTSEEIAWNKTTRCDACGAQAFVHAEKNGSGLLFCGHHGREYMPALIAQGFGIDDRTDMINNKSESSA